MEDEEHSREETSTNHLEDATTSLFIAANNLSKSMIYLGQWARRCFQKYPIITWIITLPIGYYLMQGMLEVAGGFYSFYFGGNVIASRDIEVLTHPLPLGFSLNLLYTLWLTTAILAVYRIGSLQHRLSELEEGDTPQEN